MPVSFAANGLANSVSRCIIARMPTEAAGFAATAVRSDSIGGDGSEGSNVSGVSGTVVLPRSSPGHRTRPGAHPGHPPGSRHAAGAVPGRVNGWTAGSGGRQSQVDKIGRRGRRRTARKRCPDARAQCRTVDASDGPIRRTAARYGWACGAPFVRTRWNAPGGGGGAARSASADGTPRRAVHAGWPRRRGPQAARCRVRRLAHHPLRGELTSEPFRRKHDMTTKVLVHGVPETSAIWEPMLTHLTELGHDDVVVRDMRVRRVRIRAPQHDPAPQGERLR
jgi:hypothetical protein